jgi:cytochrome c peroxidase
MRLLAVSACALTAACADEPAGVGLEPLAPAFARGGGGGGGGSPALVALGKLLYEDEGLSVNGNQSCRTCHEPAQGFAAALPGVTSRGSVVEGSVAGRFGDRKPPSAAYATPSPLLSVSGSNATGGNFWDGRATGGLLGSPAADQALGPFLNPREQALPDAACVAYRVQTTFNTQYQAAYGTALGIAFPNGTATLCSDETTAPGTPVALSSTQRAAVTQAYHNVALAIAAFEGSTEVNRFNSRFDTGTLNPTELEGSKLFGGKGKCQQCHTNKGTRPLFTDYKYHNLGVPRNPANPVYGNAGFDPGLGGFTGQSAHLGKFKTPTVRNAAKGIGRTYMHNGVFNSVKQVVDFYNSRDVLRVCAAAELVGRQTSEYGSYDPDGSGSLTATGCWPAPEYGQNLDTQNMGNLGLTEAQVDAIVAYITAMSDL